MNRAPLKIPMWRKLTEVLPQRSLEGNEKLTSGLWRCGLGVDRWVIKEEYRKWQKKLKSQPDLT